MGYRVFFSYQSDTKGNENFIYNALLEVCKRFREMGIELIPDKGMREVAGNPNLLDTMLEKGRSCDIFIADLTYVTKFKNDAKCTKYVPNPNVMLELGYAWGWHGNDHTIFIQNDTKGKAEDLPVDLKGFRFPIRFTLKGDEDKDSTLYKDVKLGLVKDLYRAILASIRFIDANRKTEFLPFEKFVDWRLKPSEQYEFIETDYFREIANEIKNLFDNHSHVVISGKKGCGKSRIVQETIKIKFTPQEINDIFYCDIQSSTLSDITNKLKEKKSSLIRSTIFIIDNCKEFDKSKIENCISDTERIICIFIVSEQLKLGIYIENQKYIRQIFGQKQCCDEKDIIARCGFHLDQIMAEFTYGQINCCSLDRGLDGIYDLTEEERRLVQYASLFSKIGFDEWLRPEFDLFCSVFNFDILKTTHITKTLISQGILINKGRYIYLDGDKLAEACSRELWDKGWLKDFSITLIMESTSLAKSFINRQIFVQDKCLNCKSYLKKYIKTELRNIKLLDTRFGNDVVYKLAEYFSHDVLLTIEMVFKNYLDYVFSEYWGIYWMLEKQLIGEKFRRVINLLFNLSKTNGNKVNIDRIVINSFCVAEGRDYNVRLELLIELYERGEFELVFNICTVVSETMGINIDEKKKSYLKNIICFLDNKRVEHKSKIDNLIIDIIPVACRFELSREFFKVVRNVMQEEKTDTQLFEKLVNAKSRLSGVAYSNDRRTIQRILTMVSNSNMRNLLYGKVVLADFEWNCDDDEIRRVMEGVAKELITKSDDWVGYIDVLLRGGRLFDGNSFWFGKVISDCYIDVDTLISRCFDIYRTIPVEEHSYSFVLGMLHNRINGEDYLRFREVRDELLNDPVLFYCGLAMCVYMPEHIEDVRIVKEAIIKHSLPFKCINKMYRVEMTADEYIDIISELIELNRDAADAGLQMLKVANKVHEEINSTKLLTRVTVLYNYWNREDCGYESAYQCYVSLVEKALKVHPDKFFAELIISSVIERCNGINFNYNYSVNNLFRFLIENYQEFVLSKIAHLLEEESFENDTKLGRMEIIFQFSNDADIKKYLSWCDCYGEKAAEFVIKFIPLIKYKDEQTPEKWTDDALYLMNKYCEKSCILDCVSKILSDGYVSIGRYTCAKRAYELLSLHKNDIIRLWAEKEAEIIENCIQEEKEDIEYNEVARK